MITATTTVNTAALEHVFELSDFLVKLRIDDTDAFVLAGLILTQTPCIGQLKAALLGTGRTKVGRTMLAVWREAKRIRESA